MVLEPCRQKVGERARSKYFAQTSNPLGKEEPVEYREYGRNGIPDGTHPCRVLSARQPHDHATAAFGRFFTHGHDPRSHSAATEEIFGGTSAARFRIPEPDNKQEQ